MLPLGAVSITIRRFAAQTKGADRRPTTQTPTTSTAFASVQPADITMQCTDAGYVDQDRRVFYSFSELRQADEATGTPADEIVWDGAGVASLAGTWRVWKSPDWPALMMIPRHWEAEAWLVQGLVP